VNADRHAAASFTDPPRDLEITDTSRPVLTRSRSRSRRGTRSLHRGSGVERSTFLARSGFVR